MDIVFVSLQFPLGTEGLFANVAGILIFRILIHFQTLRLRCRDLDPDLTNEMSKRERMFVKFLGSFTEKTELSEDHR